MFDSKHVVPSFWAGIQPANATQNEPLKAPAAKPDVATNNTTPAAPAPQKVDQKKFIEDQICARRRVHSIVQDRCGPCIHGIHGSLN